MTVYRRPRVAGQYRTDKRNTQVQTSQDREQHRHLAKRDPCLVKHNKRLPRCKIHPAGQDTAMQPAQVLQQVQTGTAVDLGQIELNVRFGIGPKANQPGSNPLFIQESEFIVPDWGPPVNARPFIVLVIIFQPMPVQQGIDHLTAFTAEQLVLQAQRSRNTGFPTMIAGYSHSEIKNKVYGGPATWHDRYQKNA